MGRYHFHRCLSVHILGRGVTPVPGSFPGHWFQILSRGTPVLAGDIGVPPPPSQVRMGYPPPGQGQDGVSPLARSGWGNPPPKDRRAECALARQQACRRTFLFEVHKIVYDNYVPDFQFLEEIIYFRSLIFPYILVQIYFQLISRATPDPHLFSKWKFGSGTKEQYTIMYWRILL